MKFLESKLVKSVLKQYLTIENVAFALVCGAATFSTSSLMTDTSLIPKQLFTIIAACIAIIALSLKSVLGYKVKIDVFVWSSIIVLLAGVEAAYALFQFLINLYFHLDVVVCGHFDNPAGLMAMMCLALPFAIYNCRKDARHRKVSIVICLMIIASIFVSRSRTGILVTILILVNHSLVYRKVAAKRRMILLSGLLVALVIGAYFINRGSADGRILIWRACWPMICETPFCGNGPGVFLRQYMDYQAAFLENYPPDSNYAMLADNVLVPFNEYICLYLNYGAVGILVLGGIVAALVISYRRKSDKLKFTALNVFAVLAFISLFSYPFTYPFTYIVATFCIYVICKDDLRVRISPFWQITCALACTAVAGLICVNTVRQIENEYLWGEAYRENDVVKYGQLFDDFSDMPYFLYNYAHQLFQIKEYDKCMEIASACNQELSNYDLELLLGDVELKRQNLVSAEKHYKKAALMCPCRLIPHQALYNVHRMAGDQSKALVEANTVIDKPLKNDSRTMKLIKLKMKKELEDFYQEKQTPSK